MLESTLIHESIQMQDRRASYKVYEKVDSFIQSDADREPKPDDNFRFRIDKHRSAFTKITIQRVNLDISAYYCKHLASFLEEQIPAVKHISNLMDVNAIMGPEPVPPQRIDPPTHLLVNVKEVKLTLIEAD